MVFGDRYTGKRAWIFLFFLLLPTVIFLNNEPVWDDHFIFESHAHWTMHALFGPYLDAMPMKIPYWRPITVLTIAIPDLLGIPIWVNKLINVVLFLIQASIAITIADEYLKSRKLAVSSLPLIALAALLALHPVFVENTLWISARADLLMGVFVLVGVFFILQLRNKEFNTQDPEALYLGFLRGFAVTWMVCGSKDSGIIWAGLALLVAFYLSSKSISAWRKYWWYLAGGILIAGSGYLVLRSQVLGQVAEFTGNIYRKMPSAGERLQLFVEFIVRSVVNIFLPLFDQAPFKSSGWFAGIAPAPLVAILIFVITITGLLIFQLYKKNKASACLVLCAIALILFHATLESYSASTYESILATRYLAPSAALIYVALTLILLNPTTAEPADIPKLINVPVASLFAILLIQSLMLWTDSRMEWSTNIGLWGNSWNHDSQSILVAENYAGSYFKNGDFINARNVARYWIAKQQEPQTTTKLCDLYGTILESDVALKDRGDGSHYANRALPIGWCNPTLARNISFFLMKDQCKLVLPMIYQAISEGDKPKGISPWQFTDPALRMRFALIAAYGEARCGENSKALDMLNYIAATNKEWAVDGPKAQELINAAHSEP